MKRVSTDVLTNRKQQGGKSSNHHVDQRYCVLCKKAGMPERKYMSHISENCFEKRYDQQSINEVLR